jgi:outer membrane protein assembly factor BamB
MTHRLLGLALLLLSLPLAGCSSLFGTKAEGPKPTGEGERIAVLQNAKQLTIDPSLSGRKPEIAAPMSNRDWPQPGGNAAHTQPHVALADQPKKIWRTDIGAGSSRDYKLLARPVVKGNAIFTMDARGRVAAFDLKDGSRLWRFDTAPEDSDHAAIGGGVTVSNERVFATNGYGEVLALNAKDGKLLWRKSVGKPYRAAPTISGDLVFAISIDNELNALSASTGEIQWHHNGIAESATLMGASSPAVSGDAVVAAYSSGELFSLRAQNGRVAWADALAVAGQVGALPAIADIRGLPVIERGRVYAISHSGRMVAIDLRSGERVWENDIGGVNTPAVSGDTVFILSNDNELMALTRDGGRIVWIKGLQRLQDPDDRESDPVFWFGPLLAGGKLWLTNSLGHLVGFDPADGQQQTNLDIDDAFYIPPIAANGTLYVLSDDADLYALR